MENRAVTSQAPNDEPLLPFADGEDAPQYTDEDLFKQPLPREECPICFLTMPFDRRETNYQSCCGKTLCGGCIHADQIENNRTNCPFCKAPAHTSDWEAIESLKERAEGDDAWAIYNSGCYYYDGGMGWPQDKEKSIKLWLQAGELGCAEAYYNLANSYFSGEGAEKDLKKAKYYFELAAMGGHVKARYNLGYIEYNAGNMGRALKHYMISACAGDGISLKEIRICYVRGHATKDDFEKAMESV